MKLFFLQATIVVLAAEAFAPNGVPPGTAGTTKTASSKLFLSPDLEQQLLSSDSDGDNANPFCDYKLSMGDLSNNGGTPWTASIGIGTPKQTLKFMIDTGTLNTWVTSSACTTDACLAHSAFTSADSTSFFLRDGGKERKVDFGPWGSMMVVDGEDISHLALHSDERQCDSPLQEKISIMLATDYPIYNEGQEQSQKFLNLAADGGMAVPSISDTEATALPEALKREGKINYQVTSFYTDPVSGKGECRMGALNMDRFDVNTMHFVDLIENPSFDFLWNVNLDGYTVQGKVVANNIEFALDTGSSWFKGGKDIIPLIRNSIMGTGPDALPDTVYSEKELKKYPSITLTISGYKYELTPEQYFLKFGNEFVLGFHVLDGMPDQMLLAGSTFLDTVYSSYINEEKCAVLLAKPKSIAESFNIGNSHWTNAYGSKLYIGPIAADSTFSGQYSSTTGATGIYPVVGVADHSPIGDSQAIAFSVNWKSLVGDYDPSWHFVSGFTGLVQLNEKGETCLNMQHLLQQNINKDVPEYIATALSTGGNFILCVE